MNLPSGGVGWWIMVLVVAAVTARLTMVSVQMGATAALVVLTVGLYLRNRTTGLAAVWVIWLLAPFVRRIFFLSEPLERADPLALAPFLVTGVVVLLELQRTSLGPRLRRVLPFVTAGYAIGIPTGLVASPESAAFALFAYLTAAGCLVIGYREGGANGMLALPNVLLIAMPLVALYSLRQYYLPLPEWDDVWLATAEINSAGSDDGDRVRPWGTLNSPGTNALILGMACVVLLTKDRINVLRPWDALLMGGGLVVVGALAVTYVRSVWAGVAVAVIAVLVVTRGLAIRRVGVVALVCVALAPVAFSGSTGAALSDRVGTFSALGDDESGQARLNTPLEILPVAITSPLGRGIGTAGEASRLAGGGGFRYTDNGYLSLMYQVGPVGFLAVMAGALLAFRLAIRNAWRSPRGIDLMAFGVLAFLWVTMLAGDQFYGIGGMIFWYMSGIAISRDEGEVAT